MNIKLILGDEENYKSGTLINCPICRQEYTHFQSPIVKDNGDYLNGWNGRGDLIVIPVEGECGHNWELCFGQHKGMTFAFIR